MTSAALGMFLLRSCSYCSWTCIASSRVGNSDQSVRLTRRLFAEHFDHWDQKGEGFAGSGLGGADDVFAIQRGLDCALLDGS